METVINAVKNGYLLYVDWVDDHPQLAALAILALAALAIVT